MNAVEQLNKALGIAFAVGLSAFLAYRGYLWRQELSKEAGRRLQHRVKQMSEDPRYRLPESDFKALDVKFSVESLRGIGLKASTVRKER